MVGYKFRLDALNANINKFLSFNDKKQITFSTQSRGIESVFLDESRDE